MYNKVMIKQIKNALRPLVPKEALNRYHYPEARAAQIKFRNPSAQMVIIGVVGSKGKTTTANMIWAALSADGTKVGQIGTANIRIGEQEELNRHHMTMPGAFILQGYLRRMADAGCTHVVLEVPSEGQTQYRHIGINFDVLVFTNVTREIMAAHRGSMEVLHQHNKRVFMQMAKSKHKIIAGKRIPKMIIANADAQDTPAYSGFKADQKISYSVKSNSDYKAIDVKPTNKGIDFKVNAHPYHLSILGTVNVINAAGAIATAFALGKDGDTIAKGLNELSVIPGRMEVIDEGQSFTVIVDYAHEQLSMQALMDGAAAMKPKGAKIITLLGAEGGGRDVEKRPAMGMITAKGSDYTIICNVDPYDDRPMQIIEDIAKGATEAGAKLGKDLFCIEDRREAIAKGLSLAQKGDIVLITGKGSEQSMVLGGKKIPWDDRTVVREELKKLKA